MSPSPSDTPSFSRTEIRTNFGRYESADAADPPANAVLVGRAEQRRQLLNLLFTHGKCSAYLITGQRGSGKTAFVNHCVDEYRLDIFGRFLRSGAGRSWPDRLGVVVLLAVAISIAFTLHGIFQFVIKSWQPGPNGFIRFVVAAPIVVVLLYPAFAARTLLDVAFVATDLPFGDRPSGFWARFKRACHRYAGLLISGGVIAGCSLARLNQKIPDIDARSVAASLLAASVILGIICGGRFIKEDIKAIQWATWGRIGGGFLLYLCLVIAYGTPEWYFEWLYCEVAWTKAIGGFSILAIFIAALGIVGEVLGRLVGTPSTLELWSNEYDKYIRPRAILFLKAIALLCASIYLLNWVEPVAPPLKQELITLVLFVLFFLSLGRLEYNWIIRPHLRSKAVVIAFHTRTWA